MRYSLSLSEQLVTAHFARRVEQRRIDWSDVHGLLADAYVTLLPGGRTLLHHRGTGLAAIWAPTGDGAGVLITAYWLNAQAGPENTHRVKPRRERGPGRPRFPRQPRR